MNKKFLLVNIIGYLLIFISLPAAEDTGNWYEKLQWWKKAKPLYATVKSRNEEIQQVQLELSKLQKQLIEIMDSFYIKAKINRVETIATVNKLIAENLDHSQEEIVNNLENLKIHLEEFVNIENQVKEAGRIIFQQGEMADHYQEKALESFGDIETVFDDKRARSYYEIIENAKDNLDLIETYFTNSLYLFLSNLIGKLNNLSSNIERIISKLSQEDITVQYFTPEEKAAQEEARLAQERAIVEEEALQQKKLKAAKLELAKLNVSWWQKIVNYILNFLKTVFGYK